MEAKLNQLITAYSFYLEIIKRDLHVNVLTAFLEQRFNKNDLEELIKDGNRSVFIRFYYKVAQSYQMNIDWTGYIVKDVTQYVLRIYKLLTPESKFFYTYTEEKPANEYTAQFIIASSRQDALNKVRGYDMFHSEEEMQYRRELNEKLIEIRT